MITVKIKNNRNKEIEAESIDDAMYKLAEEKRTSEKPSYQINKTESSLYSQIKDKIITVEKYIKISKDEMNER